MGNIIDFHSHILPGIDDGSKSIEESLSMLQLEWKNGVTKVVATPHFYPQRDKPESFLNRREAAANKLKEAMKAKPDMPEIILGAEVYYFPGISDSEVISKLTLGGKKAILIEMPASPWTETMYRQLEGIYVKHGLTPVIAHIERYLSRFKSFADLKKLSQLPVLIQANGEFFTNPFTSRKALKLLKADLIHLIGSDCHDMNARRPELEKAIRLIEKKPGERAISRIEEYQKAVLSD